MDAIIERWQPVRWMHGHTHDSIERRIGHTIIATNPRGYNRYQLNPDFQETYIFNVFH